MAQEELTKESYKKSFNTDFELTNYAIKVAQEQIYSGNEDLNITGLLKEIRKHPPKMEEKTEEHA